MKENKPNTVFYGRMLENAPNVWLSDIYRSVEVYY